MQAAYKDGIGCMNYARDPTASAAADEERRRSCERSRRRRDEGDDSRAPGGAEPGKKDDLMAHCGLRAEGREEANAVANARTACFSPPPSGSAVLAGAALFFLATAFLSLGTDDRHTRSRSHALARRGAYGTAHKADLYAFEQ